METVKVRRDGPVWLVTIDRPQARNAVDGATARALLDAFEASSRCRCRGGRARRGGGTFCAGADLKSVGRGR